MEIIANIALGICLSAACGFRVFVPLLVMSVGALLGVYTPAAGFAWLATWPALVLLGVATIVEIVAYYVPWVDNLLDTIATPAALLAGVVASAAVLGDLPAGVQWVLAVVTGAGAAGLVQTAMAVLRGASSVSTGGLANFSVSSLENVMSLMTAVLAFVIPVITLLIIAAFGMYLWRLVLRRGPAYASRRAR